MRTNYAYVTVGLLLMLGLGLAQPAAAQTPETAQTTDQQAPQFTTGALPRLSTPEAQPANPVGSGWAPQVDAAALPSSGYEGRALDIVKKINAYFNGIVNLQGQFVQTDPSQKMTKGKFYVQRPGLLRFDYAPPSAMRIVADGRYLSIENHDLKTIDKYPLESTPFRMLLRPDVDLLRDANIADYSEHDGLVSIIIEDKTGESAGSLQLVFALTDQEPGVEIRQWVITDPQGLNTRIDLANLQVGKEVSRDFFASATIGIPTND